MCRSGPGTSAPAPCCRRGRPWRAKTSEHRGRPQCEHIQGHCQESCIAVLEPWLPYLAVVAVGHLFQQWFQHLARAAPPANEREFVKIQIRVCSFEVFVFVCFTQGARIVEMDGEGGGGGRRKLFSCHPNIHSFIRPLVPFIQNDIQTLSILSSNSTCMSLCAALHLRRSKVDKDGHVRLEDFALKVRGSDVNAVLALERRGDGKRPPRGQRQRRRWESAAEKRCGVVMGADGERGREGKSVTKCDMSFCRPSRRAQAYSEQRRW